MLFNYEDILNIKCKKNLNNIIFSFLITSSALLLYFVEAYTVVDYEGIYDGREIVVALPYDKMDNIKNGEYIKIEGTKYEYNISYYSELLYSGEYYYQYINISIDSQFKENEIIELSVFYNKNKMIKKLKDLVF